MKKNYDTIIIGAGINGCAIAKEISQTNKSVLLIDKGSIGGGTSSKSSRLIHGGLRYLEQFNLSLVKESLHDRRYLIKNYPQLVKLVPFYIPIYKNTPRPWWIIKIGLSVYDLLSGYEAPHKNISIEEFKNIFPNINTKELCHVFKYFDGHTNDLELTKLIATQAQDSGVEILQDSKIKTLFIDDKKIILNINSNEINTNTLINASGAWIDEVNNHFSLPSNYSIAKVSGIHIVLPSLVVSEHLFLQTDAKRVFFMIPDNGKTIIGTTERVETVDIDNIKINQEEIAYLIKMSNKYLKKHISADDIAYSYIGTRSLIHAKENPTDMSREYKLDLHNIRNSKVLHIFGGKLTTFYSLSKKVVNLLK
ncbi:MAG: glycerol-3-phosphate dehydrogenase/oxidase [Sulfurimonas sp.]|nr:glycerol-3-phosphate dehydrogenase/oxidase [Sulfurimonas sp.]